MPEYDITKSREYQVVRTGLKYPSSNWSDIECPFCKTVDRAYWWSISGGGKKCTGCGAMHGNFGQTSPLKPKEIKIRTWKTRNGAQAAVKKAGLHLIPYNFKAVGDRFKVVFFCELAEDVTELKSRGFDAELLNQS